MLHVSMLDVAVFIFFSVFKYSYKKSQDLNAKYRAIEENRRIHSWPQIRQKFLDQKSVNYKIELINKL